MANMEEKIVINVEFEGTNLGSISEVQFVPSDIAWEDFELMLKVYADKEHLVVKYIDDEDDLIMINSPNELEEAFKIAKRNNNTLALKVICDANGGGVTDQTVGGIQEGRLQVTANVQGQTVALATVTTAEPGEVVAMSTICSSPTTMCVAASSVATTRATTCQEDGADQSAPQQKCDVTVEVKEEGKADANVPMETGEESESFVKATCLEPQVPKLSSVKPPPRYFFVRNKLNGLVMDVNGGSARPGTAVIVWHRKVPPAANQLWYQDPLQGTIRSKLNGLCLEASERGAKLTPYQPGLANQQWIHTGDVISQRQNPDCVLSLPGTAVLPGTVVRATPRSNATKLCHWVTDYIGMKQTNRETGEACAEQVVCRPRPRPRSRDCYTELAGIVGESRSRSASSSKVKDASGSSTPSGEEKKTPTWFYNYMEKFRKEISEDIARMVTRRTVRQVLRGLDGAVIASVRGTSGGLGSPVAPPVPPPRGLGTPVVQAPSPAPPVPPRHVRRDAVLYCHEGVSCDHCERTIVGIRYKCGNCDDYDLCEECESLEGIHNPEHVFLKISRPIPDEVRRTVHGGSLLKRNIYREDVTLPPAKRVALAEERLRRKEEQLRRKEVKLREKMEKYEEKMKKKEEKLKRRLEQAKDSEPKKGRLDLAFCPDLDHSEPEAEQQETPKYDALFVGDVTIPDGTHVQPGTKLVKRWRVKNSGQESWEHGVKVRMMWGNMFPVEAEVKAPALAPGEEGVLVAELTAPSQPGTYQSHWRLARYGVRFGHRVWCSVVVDPKEILEPTDDVTLPGDENAGENVPEDDQIEVAKEPLQLSPDGATAGLQGDIRDLLSFEMLEIGERHTPKVSQTATPNNTPQVVSPPKSPLPEEEAEQEEAEEDRERPVEGEGEEDREGPEGGEVAEAPVTASMTELVQERMASLGLRSSSDGDDDEDERFPPGGDEEEEEDAVDEPLEDWSSCADLSGDSDGDFYVVPIPDCFDPDLPASKDATNSVIVRKDERERSVDDMLTASTRLETEPLLPRTPGTEDAASPDVEELDSDVVIVRVDLPREEADQVAPPEADLELLELPPPQQEAPAPAPEADLETDQNANLPLDINDNSAGTPNQEPAEHVAHPVLIESESDTEDESEAEDTPNPGGAAAAAAAALSGPEADRGPRETSPSSSPGELATQLVSATLDVAKQAAASAYHTAKDVFHTLQARNQYVPPQSTWNPTTNTWTPPQQDWTPPQQDWTPDQRDWVPPEEWQVDGVGEAPATTPLSPMDQLLEMGFANRAQNRKLLDKFNNDLDKVIQELIQDHESEWPEVRH